MKKLFSLLFVALLTLSAWADTVVTVDFNNQGWSSNTLVNDLTVDGVTLTFDKGTNANNKPTYYSNTSGGALRLYGGNTMTVSASLNLKKIDFTFQSGEGSNDILSNVGNYNKAGKQWTIGSSDPSTEVVFTIDGNSGHRRIQTLVITMEDAEPLTELVPPVFNPNGGEFTGSLEVTLTCPTENSSIFYWTGTEEEQGEWIYYNGPFYVTETTTYTAVSTKGDEISEYVTVTFTKVEQIVEAPVFTPAAGGFNDRIDVTLTCATPNAQIFYSLDNEIWNQYETPIPVTDDITIWAKAKVGDVESEVVSATYTKNPTTTVEVTFDGEIDKGNSTGSRESYTVVKEPVTMFVGDGLVSSDHYRIYSGSEFKFTSTGAPIIRIDFNGISGYTPSGMGMAAGQSGTYNSSGTQGYWEGSAQEVAFKLYAQVRCYTITVTLAGEAPYLRGDVDNSGDVKIADVSALISYLLSGDASTVNVNAADCDMNGEVKIADVSALIGYLLSGEWSAE